MLKLTYLLTFCVFILNTQAQQIINGDFEQGNTGFETEYQENCNAPNPGDFCVTIPTDWTAHNPLWKPVPVNFDSVGGNLLHVNGDGILNKVVWKQNVSGLVGNQPYEFSFYLSVIHQLNPPKLGLKVNGMMVGDTIRPSTVAGSWKLSEVVFNPGNNFNTTIEIVNLSSTNEGGDFVLDNIKIQPVNILFPNIFAPKNVNNSNTTFKPTSFSGVETYELKIYNRYGRLVHISTQDDNMEPEWDGLFKDGNTYCSAGTYFWVLNISAPTIDNLERTKYLNGFVQLID